MFKKKLFLLFIVAVLGLSLVGCSSTFIDSIKNFNANRNPSKIVSNYLQALSIGDYETAYSYLCKNTTYNVSLDEFKSYYDLFTELNTFKEFELGPKQSIEYWSDINGFDYKDVVKISATEIIQTNNGKREKAKSLKHDYHLVFEDDSYKIILINNFDDDFINLYLALGWFELNNDNSNYVSAAQYATKALELDPSNPDAYFLRATAYNSLKRYNDALVDIDKCIVSIDKNNNELLSNAYNTKGLTLWSLKKKSLAIDSFNKSLQFNPDNEYAKNNLAEIKGL